MINSFLSFLSPLMPLVVTLVALVLLLEQIYYLRRKRNAPGPTIVLPFLGNAMSLVRDSTKLWERQAELAASYGFSVNYMVGKFIVFISSTQLSHLIFANVRPDGFLLAGYPFAKSLFGEHNLLYMTGEDHKDLRRRIAPNFTPRALTTYIALQQIIILQHLKSWERLSAASPDNPISLRHLARELNLETSQTVFVGRYLSARSREDFREDYNLFNMGLMKLPFDFPGFAFRDAKLAVKRLLTVLTHCAAQSKDRMFRGEEPSCLIDFWMQETVREIVEKKTAPPFSSNEEIGGYLFDFLFAAQDASTSSLLWAVSLLDSHPDVLQKVRDEVSGIWSPESHTLISADQLREMKYTQAVAREVIRHRPPPALLPRIAMEDFPLTESYTIPKGAIVFLSVYEASLQGFKHADRFDPERFSEERQEEVIHKRNFLAFGAGAHQCVGQRYALNQLVLFIAMFSTLLDFKRHRTDDCDEFAYLPTLCPKDGCKVFLSRRTLS